MRRLILGWKALGHARRFRSEIVNYADDLCVLGKAPAAEMLAAVERLMAGLKLAVNERKTRCLRCPEEAFEFLGYRIGRNYRPHGQGAYIGTRPSKASVRSICRRISEMTSRRWSRLPSEARVERLNRVMTGWANYFSLGQVSPAYSAVDRHAIRRLRRWLCLKHKVKSGKYVRFASRRYRTSASLTTAASCSGAPARSGRTQWPGPRGRLRLRARLSSPSQAMSAPSQSHSSISSQWAMRPCRPSTPGAVHEGIGHSLLSSSSSLPYNAPHDVLGRSLADLCRLGARRSRNDCYAACDHRPLPRESASNFRSYARSSRFRPDHRIPAYSAASDAAASSGCGMFSMSTNWSAYCRA